MNPEDSRPNIIVQEAPVVPSNDPSLPIAAPPKKFRKKWYWIAGTIIAIIALAGGGWLYYSRPSKVLADAFEKLVASDQATFKGNFQIDSGDQDGSFKTSVEFDAKGTSGAGEVNSKTKLTFGATDITVDTSVIFAQKDLFVKINNLRPLSDLFVAFVSPEVMDAYQPAIDKVDGKWIKIGNGGQEGGEVNRCTAALGDLKVSNSDQSAIRSIFSQHQFLVNQKPSEGSKTAKSNREYYYSLSFDQAAADQFVAEVGKLDSFKNIKEACGITSTDVVQTETSTATASAEVWVDKFSHTPTKFSFKIVDGSETITLFSTIDLTTKVQVTPPSDAINLNDVFKDLQAPTTAEQQLDAQLDAELESL